MKLSYRGVTYSYNPPEVETTLGEVGGKYRGLDWRFRNLKKPPVLQPTASLKYRGVYYQTGTKPTPNSTQPTKTPAFSTQEKARSLMHNQKRTLKNRQQSMLYRTAAARTDGNLTLAWMNLAGSIPFCKFGGVRDASPRGDWSVSRTLAKEFISDC
jgi:hypothetical protein